MVFLYTTYFIMNIIVIIFYYWVYQGSIDQAKDKELYLGDLENKYIKIQNDVLAAIPFLFLILNCMYVFVRLIDSMFGG